MKMFKDLCADCLLTMCKDLCADDTCSDICTVLDPVACRHGDGRILIHGPDAVTSSCVWTLAVRVHSLAAPRTVM
jgi:hypothetical protein